MPRIAGHIFLCTCLLCAEEQLKPMLRQKSAGIH